MITKIILLTLLSIGSRSSYTDSLILPIKNGVIIKDFTDSSLTIHPEGVLIAPTDQLEVRSCSDGIVRSTFQFHDTYTVIVSAGNNLYYRYSNIDTVVIKKGQKITKGIVLGMLNAKTHEKKPIIFSTFKGDKYVNALNYLIWK